VDLTLQEGVGLQAAIQTARVIDQQAKQLGFNQFVLDEIARKGFQNAHFYSLEEEGDSFEGLLSEKIYIDEVDKELSQDFAEKLAKSCSRK